MSLHAVTKSDTAELETKVGAEPEMKMEEQESARPKSETASGRAGDPPCVFQAGTLKHSPRGIILQQVKQEPEEGLASQRWEAQWQEFLRAVQSPQSGWGSPPLPEPAPWGDAKASVAPAARAAGSERQRRNFREFRYQDAPGPREAYSRLRELCHRWLKPERHAKEQMLELVILEQFLAVLPPEIMSWVKVRSPETCAQAVALAEDFLQRQREAEGPGEQGSEGLFQNGAAVEDGAALGIVQKPLRGEVKQEGERDASSPSAGECQGEDEEKLPGGSEEGTEHQAPEENEGNLDRPKRQEGNEREEWKTKSVAYKGGPFHENTGQQRVLNRKRRNKCLVCGKVFRDEAYLNKHQRTHTGEKPYECSDCGKSFRWSSDLHRHQRTHTGEKPYKCLDCGKSFRRSSNLHRHRRTHTGEKSYECSDCGKTFRCSSSLISHRRTHTGEKPYECSDCGKSFRLSSNLISHKRTHTGEKPYECPDCEKCFRRSSHLNTHKRIHTGQKPYTCSDCSKTFSDRSNLLSHLRIHTGQKPYTCSDCTKTFSNKSNLLSHQRIHSGEKPYECLDCGKSFSVCQYLTRHQRRHTTEKLYECADCGKRFSQSQYLIRHQKHSHRRKST
ncbi:zinc finger protein 586-like [Elgaria multicarinata webbii]|uniref:zinc finger protein 586-like n=1 Tax=Elgaria multicarinata webbii TaxID=159646 RepID=UPI002FCCDAA6